MKGKTIFTAFLVAVLVFVGVGSVALGDAETQVKGPNDRVGRLKCRGPASFRAKAIFWWTHLGEPVGTPVVFKCRDNGSSGRKTLVYPEGACDFHVKIKVKDRRTGASKTCVGGKTFDPGAVPGRYRKACRLGDRVPDPAKAVLVVKP